MEVCVCGGGVCVRLHSALVRCISRARSSDSSRTLGTGVGPVTALRMAGQLGTCMLLAASWRAGSQSHGIQVWSDRSDAGYSQPARRREGRGERGEEERGEEMRREEEFMRTIERVRRRGDEDRRE